MDIATRNRQIALKALELFEQDLDGKDPKPYLNAVQKAMLLLGSQGLRRTVLYISAQMGKDEDKNKDSETKTLTNKKAFELLHAHLSELTGIEAQQFQHHILRKSTKDALAREEARMAFFLLCLKRLAHGKAVSG